MNKPEDIMKRLNGNPYKLPENYSLNMESKVREKLFSDSTNKSHITKTETSLLSLLRANFALLLTFAFVFGIGYGVIRLVTPNDILNKTKESRTAIATIDSSQQHINKTNQNNEDSAQEAIEDYLINTNLTMTALASIE